MPDGHLGTVARPERGRVHGAYASRPHIADEHRLHALDSVHADDLGVRPYRAPTLSGGRGSAESKAKRARGPGVARPHHDEKALAVPERPDRDGEKRPTVTGENEIDGAAHGVGPAAAGPTSSIGPLNVRRKASSWRSSVADRRSGRSSLWPLAAAGARL